jgi:hypothetical protein
MKYIFILCAFDIVDVDKGMTHRVLIFGLCGFKPRSKPVERIIKAHIYIRLAQPMKPKLGVHFKESKREDLVELLSI